MSRWPRYAGCTLILLVWLFLISLPLLAFVLAARQEIVVGRSEYQLRLFLLQETETEGIGVEIARPFPGTQLCTQASVHYLMWVGEAENVTYCLCRDPQTQQFVPASCPSP